MRVVLTSDVPGFVSGTILYKKGCKFDVIRQEGGKFWCNAPFDAYPVVINESECDIIDEELDDCSNGRCF